MWKEDVRIPSGNVRLDGMLAIPTQAQGIVLFVHGSGSSRFSSRNQLVARRLNDEGLATLLFDLLTRDEEVIDSQTRHLRFDIKLLAKRLEAATQWVKSDARIKQLKLGYFGASTGAAAALIAAASRPNDVEVIVSRGGRPDLAGPALAQVKAPTLLIVGALDVQVIDLNIKAISALRLAETKLEIIEGATHLFEEPGALESVGDLAATWFTHHLQQDETGSVAAGTHTSSAAKSRRPGTALNMGVRSDGA